MTLGVTINKKYGNEYSFCEIEIKLDDRSEGLASASLWLTSSVVTPAELQKSQIRSRFRTVVNEVLTL